MIQVTCEYSSQFEGRLHAATEEISHLKAKLQEASAGSLEYENKNSRRLQGFLANRQANANANAKAVGQVQEAEMIGDRLKQQDFASHQWSFGDGKLR